MSADEVYEADVVEGMLAELLSLVYWLATEVVTLTRKGLLDLAAVELCDDHYEALTTALAAVDAEHERRYAGPGDQVPGTMLETPFGTWVVCSDGIARELAP